MEQKCQDCGKTKPDVKETTCPFAAEIHDDHNVAITVCDDCHQERAWDI